jgi:hypothetical protein
MARTKHAAVLSSVKILLSEVLPTLLPELEKAVDKAYRPDGFLFSLEHRLHTDPVPAMLKQALTYWIKCWLKNEKDLEPFSVRVNLTTSEVDGEVYHTANIVGHVDTKEFDPNNLTFYNEINEAVRVAKRTRDDADAPTAEGESEPKKARVETQ